MRRQDEISVVEPSASQSTARSTRRVSPKTRTEGNTAKPMWEHSTGLKHFDRAFWERTLGITEERLRHAVADVPKQLKRLCLTYWFPGECFGRAIYFVGTNRKLATAEYVFGQTVSGGLGQHGWVEFEDWVFDGVLQQWYTKKGY